MKNKTIIFYDFEATSVSRDAEPISLGLVAVTRNYKRYESHQVNEMLADTLSIKSNGYQTYDENNNVVKYFVNEHPPTIKTFYSEFTDFQIGKCDFWVRENIVEKLLFNNDVSPTYRKSGNDSWESKGDKEWISHILKEWLSQFKDVCFIADFDMIDKPMLIDLIADWKYNSKSTTNQRLTENGSKITHHSIKLHKIGLPIHLPNIKYNQFFDLHTIFWLKGIDTDISRDEFAFTDPVILELPPTNSLIKIAGQKHNSLWDAYVTWKGFEKLNKD